MSNFAVDVYNSPGQTIDSKYYSGNWAVKIRFQCWTLSSDGTKRTFYREFFNINIRDAHTGQFSGWRIGSVIEDHPELCNSTVSANDYEPYFYWYLPIVRADKVSDISQGIAACGCQCEGVFGGGGWLIFDVYRLADSCNTQHAIIEIVDIHGNRINITNGYGSSNDGRALPLSDFAYYMPGTPGEAQYWKQFT